MSTKPGGTAREAAGTGRALLALLGWLALVVVLTWPLARLPRRAMVVGAGCDARYSMWALAWQVHALATDPAHYFDANIYYPAKDTLAYGPTAMGALPLFAPVFAATGNPVLAANVLFLVGCALTAWTLGLVTTRWTGSAGAGAVAGATFLAAPWVVHEWVPTCPHYAMLMWFPLIIERAARPQLRVRDAAVLAVLIVLQGAVEVVYMAPVVFATVAAVAAGRMLRPSTRATGVRLAAALVAGALVLSPLVAEHLAVRRENPALSAQTPWYRRTDLGLPPRVPVFPWSLFGWWREYAPALPPPPMALPPLAFLVIAAGGASRWLRRRGGPDDMPGRAWRHAALWTVMGALLSLPPRVELAGAVVALPHLWLYEYVPGLRVLRVSARLAVGGLMGLCLLSGLGAAEITRRVHPRAGRRALVAVMACALLVQPRMGIGYPFGYVARPVPWPYRLLLTSEPHPYYETLLAGRGPLLDVNRGLFLPATRRPSPESDVMFRSIGHWRPLLNGYSSYYPAQYDRLMALAARLPNDLDALEALRAETGVELILVWPRQLPPATRAAWNALATGNGNASLALVGSGEKNALLFRVR